MGVRTDLSGSDDEPVVTKDSMMFKKWSSTAVVLLLLASCGGSGGGSSTPSATTTTTTPVATTSPNTLAVTVDAGPSSLTSLGEIAANTLFATVTICTPGSTTACRTIDHVQVDTGSTGLRLLYSTLGGAVAPAAVREPLTGRPLLECVQFADGYSFGSVGTVDLTMGSRTIAGLPIQVIGDPAAGTAPGSCASGPAENTVADFGANGVLGIGNFIQDCGAACVTRAVAGTYYTCPTTAGGSACAATTVALSQQVPNPVSRLATDNNGVVVQLPAVASPGATTVNGTVLFGVATQTDNALGATRPYTLTTQGTLTATLNGATLSGSFIDSGSNANFFPSTAIATCATNASFYCPVTTSGVKTSVSQSVIITGTNATSSTLTFNVDNADTLFATSLTAFPGLAGPSGTLLNGSAGVFDFGLPFFFGRSVAVLIEGATAGGVTGPAVAF